LTPVIKCVINLSKNYLVWSHSFWCDIWVTKTKRWLKLKLKFSKLSSTRLKLKLKQLTKKHCSGHALLISIQWSDNLIKLWQVSLTIKRQLTPINSTMCLGKNVTLFTFVITRSDVIKFSQFLAETYPGNLKQHMYTAHHISFYTFVLYLVKTS